VDNYTGEATGAATQRDHPITARWTGYDGRDGSALRRFFRTLRNEIYTMPFGALRK